jgi:hypothetical protein
MRNFLGFLLLVGLAFSLAAVVHADFAPIPLEQLVKDAVLIVEGKVAKVEDAGFVRGQRKYDAAVVQVKAVLKGDAKVKEVRIGQPAPGGLALSTDIRFKVGQEGIWLLKKQADAKGKEAEVYWALHPSQLQPLAEREKVAKVIKDQAGK